MSNYDENVMHLEREGDVRVTTSEAPDMPPTTTNEKKKQSSRASMLPLAAVVSVAAGLFLLAWGYWGAWLPHPAASLNILGIDLPEYVKFVPEVTGGQIPIKREIFFFPLLSLIMGLIMLATIQQPRLPIWLRAILLALAVPASLAMLPPAWTPALLRTPEFRLQTLAIAFFLLAVLLSPLIHRHLSDWWRGVILVLAGVIPFLALNAYNRLLPALEKLYAHPLNAGSATYLVAVGAILVGIGGVLMIVNRWRQRMQATV